MRKFWSTFSGVKAKANEERDGGAAFALDTSDAGKGIVTSFKHVRDLEKGASGNRSA